MSYYPPGLQLKTLRLGKGKVICPVVGKIRPCFLAVPVVLPTCVHGRVHGRLWPRLAQAGCSPSISDLTICKRMALVKLHKFCTSQFPKLKMAYCGAQFIER